MNRSNIYKLLPVVTAFGLLLSCNTETVKEKAKNTINNTGKSLGRGTTEFFKGVKEGVDKTLQCNLEVASTLKEQGIGAGKFHISQSKGASDNVLSVYMIFEKDFNRKVSVKVFDKKGLEYGRTSTMVEGKSGEAYNIDFVFDPRTEIEAKSRFVLE